jgi:hypothetical protein
MSTTVNNAAANRIPQGLLELIPVRESRQGGPDYARAAVEIKTLALQIKGGLTTKLDDIDQRIKAAGYVEAVGGEDEMYFFGKTALDFEALHGAELRARFPLIDRIYTEADAVLLRGTTIRLGMPNMRKWEITTKHMDESGQPVSLKQETLLMNQIRQFIVSKQKEWDLIVDYTARPIPDLREAVKSGYLPKRITDTKLMAGLPKQIPITDREALEYLQQQVKGEEFDKQVAAFKIDSLVNMVDALVRKNLDKCSAPVDDDLPRKIRLAIESSDFSAVINDAGFIEEISAAITEKNLQMEAAIAENVSEILTAQSFDSLCVQEIEPETLKVVKESVVQSKKVPGCGVDANVSLLKDGRNAMYDEQEPSKTSKVFWAVSAADIQLVGAEQGSLLPSTQSYDPATYHRMGRMELAASARAAVGTKASGAHSKVSPPLAHESAARYAEHDFDRMSELTLRRERREGEPGGELGDTNDLGQLHYGVSVGLAIVNGLDMLAAGDEPKSYAELQEMSHPFNKSHGQALTSYANSDLYRQGHGEELHRDVKRHAQLQIHLKAHELQQHVR